VNITYRLARPSEATVLLRLMRSLQDDDPWSSPFDDARVLCDLQALLDTPHYGIAWLICEGDDPIGYLLLCFDYSLEYSGKGAWIDEIFIDRAHRGRGLGTDALRFAETAAREAGAHVLHLEVNRGNPAADLYRRHGFVDHDRYLMSKWLATADPQSR
jgi:GNAT superfamily N-acetyltransferase